MYYLQSRYYDPAIGRFINADVFTTTDADGFLSCNMFAYCENDPVNRNDPSGGFFNTIIGAVVGGTIGAISAAIAGDNILAGVASGAASGAIAGFGVDVAAATIATGPIGIGIAAFALTMTGAAGSVVGDVIDASGNGRKLDKKAVAKRAIMSGLLNLGTGMLNLGLSKQLCQAFNKSSKMKDVAKWIAKSTKGLAAWGKTASNLPSVLVNMDYAIKVGTIQKTCSYLLS